MIKVLLLILGIQGTLLAFELPAPGGYHVDVENDAEIIDAAEPLPGTNNLHEKTLPLIRLQIPSGYLTGLKNLDEKSQLQSHPPPSDNNIKEKSTSNEEIMV